MIELQNINFTKDNKKILNNINIKFENNKFYVITGPNGSGKSTLAKIIMGINKPNEGKIIFNHKDITIKNVTSRAKMGISFAFQQPVLFKGITVYDLLKFATKKEITKKEACAYLSQVGLCAIEYIDREINNTLSGGELKRIEIASIIARNPSVAIFDEPEAGIDLWSFENLTNIFKKLSKSYNGTIIIISHQEKILKMADEIILLENGTISKIGSKNEILENIICHKCCMKGTEDE